MQSPEIRLGVQWEIWQPKIIKFATINAAGKKLSPTTSHFLELTKKNIPTGPWLDIVYYCFTTLPLDKMAPVSLCLLTTILDKKHANKNGENILRKIEVC